MTLDPTSTKSLTSEPHFRTNLTRVGTLLVLGTFAWVIPFSGTIGVLLPAKIATIAPDEKISILALLTVVGAVVALLANFVFGALSDLTRSRFGSRHPWMIGGGLVAGACMFLLSTANTTPALISWWCLFLLALNALTASITAVVPDRVPLIRRGALSAVSGVGFLVGTAISQLTAAHFLSNPVLGIRLFALVAAVLPLIAVFIAPDSSNRYQVRPTWSARGLLDSFALPALRAAPDFYRALFGRLVIIVGYFMVNSYQLYILTDYLKLSVVSAGALVGQIALLTLGGSLIGALVSGSLSDLLGRRKLPLYVATVLFSGAIVLPFFSPTVTAMLAFALIGGFGVGIFYAVDAALMSEVLPSDQSRGKDLGILNMATTGGQALAPVVSSAIVGSVGFGPVFLVAMICCVIGAVALVPIKPVK